MDVPWTWRMRLTVLALIGVWALGVCGHRLYQLQAVEGAIWQRRARSNTILSVPVPPPRGRILDARGRVLATSQPGYSVTVTPDEAGGDMRLLAHALRVPLLHIQHRIQRGARLSPHDPTVVANALSSVQVARVATILPHLRGVHLQIRPQRRYPYGTMLSHVLGYVGEISEAAYRRLRRQGYHADDTVGQSGLEQQYDAALHGRSGAENLYVDAMGRTVGTEGSIDPHPGYDIRLSLDMDLQAFAEQRLQKTLDELTVQNGETTAGAIVMLDPRNGRVRAMVSRPNFDPRQFARGIRQKEYERLMTDPLHPLLSRAYQASYPPGSTFKPLSASACLQSKVCTPDSVFYCSGEYKGFHCFVRSGHGSIDFTEAIAQSCDVTFYQLADRLGIWRMDKFCAAFGLGRPTGIDLPDEQGGLLPTPGWKKRVYHDDWYEGDTINLGIGQGTLLVTPLQMAVAVSAIANGGYVYRPHLVDAILGPHGRVLWTYRAKPVRRIPVKPKWLAAVRKGMEGVVDHGTGVAAKSTLLQLAGKTGTAEAVPTVDNPQGRNHTWFDSFAPAPHPQIVCIVLVVKAGGYGGGVCAPIAKDCIEYWWTHDAKH
ncbi:MAG: penicillin-binding protein 2 [Candidatus Xenobia bacterium]